MSEKKASGSKTKAKKKPSKKPAKAAKPKGGTAPKKAEEPKEKKVVSLADSGIVIVDEYTEVDQEKVNEERRAYLEEARSQEASD
ncbi:hypothetical protein CENSYa_0042 [Cenarchaeum symbiosum A]|uniref:Uncharacterized protein n=1 Tax=Cenarchaeum symbiosum (strain A) TaxID=414004 RepID=A0RZA8_CENSY|nr:hypothetical protein CENSYa_0042 [Cenarchaeum symbiosum A]